MAETLANWGDFIGGIAVVISLIYVGMQIRASVAQARLDSFTKSTELWSQFTSAVAGDGETWRIFHQGTRDYDKLNPEEKSRFGFVISMYFGIIDTIMMHQAAGIYPSQQIYERSLEQAYAVFQLPGVQKWFVHAKGRVFAPKVEEYLLSRKEKELAK